MTVVKTRIVKIGNSRGLRIPKAILEQLNLKNEVELEIQENELVIRPTVAPRQNWEEQFELMAERGDDALLDDATPSLSVWDEEEWAW
ncbi:MAG TPA: AbrB/MazE/SpoVT family DNA-binding domain-containing protein [Chloroflexi bacterium]|nr:AbrB/MazE/SpoVT family DNA-binding domain-containing protein [Chloroflexota bacterium]